MQNRAPGGTRPPREVMSIQCMMQLCVVLVLWVDWGGQGAVLLLLMSSPCLTPFQELGESGFISKGQMHLGESFF